MRTLLYFAPERNLAQLSNGPKAITRLLRNTWLVKAGKCG